MAMLDEGEPTPESDAAAEPLLEQDGKTPDEAVDALDVSSPDSSSDEEEADDGAQDQEDAVEETAAPSAAQSRKSMVSLAWTSTTPIFAALLISLVMIGTHVLFYYAQTAPMWKLHVSTDM